MIGIWILAACPQTPTRPLPETNEQDSARPEQDTALPDPGRGPLELARLEDADDLDPADDIVRVALTAAPKTHRFVDTDGTEHLVEGYAYNGMTPGPVIRAKIGDFVQIDFTNSLDQPTTIHWHGVGVPFEMDGVAWMSSPTPPGGTFTYAFTVARAGTFWYHPHFNTNQQVSGGLYGVFIVEDPAEPVPDDDRILVIDDWHFDGIDAHDHVAAEGTWTVNGQIQPTLTAEGGTNIRARVLNASNLGYLDLSLPELRVIGADQGLGAAVALPESLRMASGDRAEVELRIGEAGFSLLNRPYVHQGGPAWGDPAPLMAVAVSTPAPAAPGVAWPFSGRAPSPDPGVTDLTHVFSGSPETGVWMLNGEVFPDVTIETLTLGQEAIIEVRNLSPTEHPFHLHGMPFEVLSVDGVPSTAYRLEDTINVSIYGTVRLRIIANNPGDWMTHCHILPHADGGMMTVLRVAPR